MDLDIPASAAPSRRELSPIHLIVLDLTYFRKEPGPRRLSTAMKHHMRSRHYCRYMLLWKIIRYASNMRSKPRYWREAKRIGHKCLCRTGKTSVYKQVGIPQKVSEPTSRQAFCSVNLRHGGILRFYLEFHLQPESESWYLPQGPSPTPQTVYAQVFGILCKELGLQNPCRTCSKNDGSPVFLCLNQPESTNDKSFAQGVGQTALLAACQCIKRLELETVDRMIDQSEQRSEWITKGDSSECSVGHSEGNLSVTLPCEHMVCMHCEIESAMKANVRYTYGGCKESTAEADSRHKCAECKKPFDIISFGISFGLKFIEGG